MVVSKLIFLILSVNYTNLKVLAANNAIDLNNNIEQNASEISRNNEQISSEFENNLRTEQRPKRDDDMDQGNVFISKSPNIFK